MLNISSGLGDSLDGVTRDDKLVLLGRRDLDGNTLSDLDVTDTLLTQEVSDLNDLTVVDDVDVDGEMRVDVSHLVLVTLGDTSDQVSNERLDSSESSNVLSVTVVNSDLDGLVGELGEGDINMSKVLGERTSGAGNGDDTGLDFNGDALGDVKSLVSLDVLHC